MENNSRDFNYEDVPRDDFKAENSAESEKSELSIALEKSLENGRFIGLSDDSWAELPLENKALLATFDTDGIESCNNNATGFVLPEFFGGGVLIGNVKAPYTKEIREKIDREYLEDRFSVENPIEDIERVNKTWIDEYQKELFYSSDIYLAVKKVSSHLHVDSDVALADVYKHEGLTDSEFFEYALLQDYCSNKIASNLIFKENGHYSQDETSKLLKISNFYSRADALDDNMASYELALEEFDKALEENEASVKFVLDLNDRTKISFPSRVNSFLRYSNIDKSKVTYSIFNCEFRPQDKDMAIRDEIPVPTIDPIHDYTRLYKDFLSFSKDKKAVVFDDDFSNFLENLNYEYYDDSAKNRLIDGVINCFLHNDVLAGDYLKLLRTRLTNNRNKYQKNISAILSARYAKCLENNEEFNIDEELEGFKSNEKTAGVYLRISGDYKNALRNVVAMKELLHYYDRETWNGLSSRHGDFANFMHDVNLARNTNTDEKNVFNKNYGFDVSSYSHIIKDKYGLDIDASLDAIPQSTYDRLCKDANSLLDARAGLLRAKSLLESSNDAVAKIKEISENAGIEGVSADGLSEPIASIIEKYLAFSRRYRDYYSQLAARYELDTCSSDNDFKKRLARNCYGYYHGSNALVLVKDKSCDDINGDFRNDATKIIDGLDIDFDTLTQNTSRFFELRRKLIEGCLSPNRQDISESDFNSKMKDEYAQIALSELYDRYRVDTDFSNEFTELANSFGHDGHVDEIFLIPNYAIYRDGDSYGSFKLGDTSNIPKNHPALKYIFVKDGPLEDARFDKAACRVVMRYSRNFALRNEAVARTGLEKDYDNLCNQYNVSLNDSRFSNVNINERMPYMPMLTKREYNVARQIMPFFSKVLVNIDTIPLSNVFYEEDSRFRPDKGTFAENLQKSHNKFFGDIDSLNGSRLMRSSSDGASSLALCRVSELFKDKSLPDARKLELISEDIAMQYYSMLSRIQTAEFSVLLGSRKDISQSMYLAATGINVRDAVKRKQLMSRYLFCKEFSKFSIGTSQDDNIKKFFDRFFTKK